jgi:hypothetical protein
MNKEATEYIKKQKFPQKELYRKLSLEIVNVKIGTKWLSPSHLNAKERTLLYFV